MTRCPRCKTDNVPDAAFCSNCGAALSPSAPSATPAGSVPVTYAGGQTLYEQVRPYASARDLTTATVVLLSACGVLSFFEIITTLVVLSELLAGTYSEFEPTTGDVLSTGVACVNSLAFVGSAVVFLIWLYRVSRNLRSLGVRRQRFSPGWAVGYWFIPIVNLIRPYQVVKEIWVESRPPSDDIGGRQPTSTAIIGWWWATGIVNGVLSQISFRMAWWPQASTDVLRASAVLAAVASALVVVDAVLAIKIVRDIYRRQEARNRWLEATPAMAVRVDPT